MAGCGRRARSGDVRSRANRRQDRILEQAGWDALVAGRGHDAADAFRQAIAGDPKNPRLHLGAGAAAFLERRDRDAKDALERALSLDPKLTRARALLGQVLYLSFEGPEQAALAAQALESLDRAYWRIGGTLTAYPPLPISVVLYTDEQFRDITRSPSWAVGAYDGTIRVPMRGALDEAKELDRVLAHEFTHALVRGLAPRGVPAWLNEGLATALESSDLVWAETRVHQAATPVPLDVLPAAFGRLSGTEAQLAYAASALAARRLIEEVGGAGIMNLLRDLGEGDSFEAAFVRRVHRSLAEFQASLF